MTLGPQRWLVPPACLIVIGCSRGGLPVEAMEPAHTLPEPAARSIGTQRVGPRGSHSSDAGPIATKPGSSSRFEADDVAMVVGAAASKQSSSFVLGVVTLNEPQRIRVGFDTSELVDFYMMYVDPKSGRIFYHRDDTLTTPRGWYWWRIDDDDWSGKIATYPKRAGDNDPHVDVSGCGAAGVEWLLPSPESSYLYGCSHNGVFDSQGERVAAPELVDGLDGVLCVGFGELLLARKVADFVMVDPRAQTRVPVTSPVGDPTVNISAVRAYGPGFWLVLNRSISGQGELEAVYVDSTGKPRPLGTYPPLPSELKLTGRFALDVHGALYSKTESQVQRRTIDGDIDTVFDIDPHRIEAGAGAFSIFWFTTGP